ncbi:hypothetical protein SLEP1_g58584 [Rubroshorea leprosula]|uniref:Uncharacterized protein n=1 Tax=Rubroshorea leprosula TaxID=152421 RepID=A0AAV5MRA8_9ROSI|nr:hypothetical protein SLEP1_g58584 [Rubroshorea leprosula]
MRSCDQLSNKELFFSESRIRILLERPSLSKGKLSRGNRAAIDGENPAIKRELAEVESASVSPAGKLDLAIEISSRFIKST